MSTTENQTQKRPHNGEEKEEEVATKTKKVANGFSTVSRWDCIRPYAAPFQAATEVSATADAGEKIGS